MHAPIKYAEKGLQIAANGVWQVFSRLNKISQNPAFTPKWSDKPMLKSYQKTKPPLGWPRHCPIHGHFEDVMAIDTAFFKHLEEVFPGRDIQAHNDEKLHNHGSSTIKHGRGAVLTVDLTNRCNMMCDPCFMDANQVGFVHELSWEDIKTVLDNAITIKPRRQMSVQFSAMRICSLTASVMPPTRTAASATCSTSSCARSRTCTRPVSTSCRW
jgi:hypothetical protein